MGLKKHSRSTTNSILYISIYIINIALTSNMSIAKTIHIPQDRLTIQSGIDFADNGDTVLVDDGRYIENINIGGKKILLCSHYILDSNTNHIFKTIIDGNGEACVINMKSGESDSTIINGFTIINGYDGYGGGIHCYSASPSLKNLIIEKNIAENGGGICAWGNSSPYIENVTVRNNRATDSGGGIFIFNSPPIKFSKIKRCNIYHNYAGAANDIYGPYQMEVFVDTFTVKKPTEFHAYQASSFLWDIQNGKIEQVNNDLFVSPNGNDSNNGLSKTTPLKTISFALSKIISDESNPHRIHLENGLYSFSNTGEIFPLNMVSYVSLIGNSRQGTILDAEKKGRVLSFYYDNEIYIKSLMITGGSQSGIRMNNSNATFESLIIKENIAWLGLGGGVSLNNSNPLFKDVIITKNSTSDCEPGNGGGIVCSSSNPSFENVTISNNNALGSGGGIFIYSGSPIFNSENRCNIYSNYAPTGKDLYSRHLKKINVYVDTFTVLTPDENFASPLDNFNFDIKNAKIQLKTSNLYVSLILPTEKRHPNYVLIAQTPMDFCAHLLSAFSVCYKRFQCTQTIHFELVQVL